ncbi:hypothetical protein CTM_08266 [Clostridium tetanomorphum DSM 665]|nr:hypothetical protein CTM_08266 [Clostridium tetanomorphum DSM 665]
MNFDNNMMEQFFNIQKNMIGAWQEAFLPKVDTKKENSKSEESKDTMDFFKDIMEFNNKIFSSFNNSNAYEVFKKMSVGADVYYNVYKLWEDLTQKSFKPTMEEYNKVYDKWKDKYMDFVKDSFIPYLPKPMQSFVKEPMELFKLYTNFVNKFWGPWMETSNDLKEYMVEGAFKNPVAYLDFIKLWKDNYDKTFSKFLNSPTMGINREYFEKQLESMDTFVKYMTILGEFSATIFSVAQETMEEILKNYMEMLKNGTQPKTFKEFYEYWSKENENAYQKLFNTEDFSKLLAEVVDSSMVFKMRCDNLMEEYISFMPIPTKTEINSLYKTVYELKKELKSVKKELKELKDSKSDSKGSK